MIKLLKRMFREETYFEALARTERFQRKESARLKARLFARMLFNV